MCVFAIYRKYDKSYNVGRCDMLLKCYAQCAGLKLVIYMKYKVKFADSTNSSFKHSR